MKSFCVRVDVRVIFIFILFYFVDESNDEDDGELEVEKKSRLLDEEKMREAEEAKEEGMQLNIQGDFDDFRLPTTEVCSVSALKAGVEDCPPRRSL